MSFKNQPPAAGELTLTQLEANFRSLSLRELSFEAAQLAATLEDTDSEDPDGLLSQLQQYLADATEAKIDGYVLFKEYLESEIDTWKAKKEALVEMCDRLIAAKQSRLEALKRSLLILHEQGLLPDYLMGKDKAIQILPNPKPTVTLLCQPSDRDFPTAYQRQEIKLVADKEAIAFGTARSAIASAWQSGEDVSGFAQVTLGKQVRFKNAPRRRSKP